MPSFVYFLLAVAALIGGYALYSRVVERLFGVNTSRATPAETMSDGVDYIKMPPAKIFLIQLLNIAGVGPVFGPIMARQLCSGLFLGQFWRAVCMIISPECFPFATTVNPFPTL